MVAVTKGAAGSLIAAYNGRITPPFAAKSCDQLFGGSMRCETRKIGTAVDAIAPDGSEVRLLCSTLHGSMACFRLAPNAVSNAVAHRTVEAIWYFPAGRGRTGGKLG